MKYQLVIVERVYTQLNEVTLWYEQQQKGLGNELLIEFETALENVVSNPVGYQKKNKQFRHTMLKRFPYLLIFEIKQNEIIVHRIIHEKQNPVKRYKTK